MIFAPRPANDAQRILEVEHLEPATPEDLAAYDTLVKMATELLDVPIAFVSIITRDEQTFPSIKGLDFVAYPRDTGFCAHTILQDRPMIVDDTQRDMRFFDHPAVTGPPNIRFYAGVPLLGPTGQPIGTFCALDSQPHTFEPRKLAILELLAQQVAAVISTRRLLAEAERARFELNDLLENAEDLVLSVAGDGRLLYVNRRWRESLGYTDFTQLASLEFVALEHRGTFATALDRLAAGEPITTLETVFIAKGNRRILVEGSISARRQHGQFVAMRGIFRDVTARRAAEMTRLAFFEHSPDVACILNLEDFSVRTVNAAGRRILAPMLNAQDPFAAVHPDDVATIRTAATGLREGKPLSRLQLRLRDDVEVWRTLLLHAIADMDNACVYVSGLDITDRRKVEEMAETLATFFDNVPALIGIIDLIDGEIHYVSRNAAANAFFQYTGDVGGLRAADVGNQSDDQLAFWVKTYEEAERTEQPVTIEVRTHGRWLRVTVSRVRTAATRRFCYIAEDITERKRADAERMEADRVKTEFIGTVSHEIRTPLTAIHASLRLLTANISEEERRELLGIAQSHTARLSRLVNDVLDFQRLDAGQALLHLKPVTTQGVISRAVDLVMPLANEAGIELLVHSSGKLAFVADEDRLVQVLVNLISNALKYAVGGTRVDVTAESAGNTVRFAVTDNGAGIAESDLARLFQRFVRLGESETRRSGGTGLGLAISKALVEQHGGTMGATSVPGKTTFWFEVPTSQNGAPTGPVGEPPRP